MMILRFNRYVLSVCAGAAMLAGCGALPLSLMKGQEYTQPLPGAALVREPSLPPELRPNLGPSWIAPKARQVDLLYVASQMTTNVDVYSYPQGKKAGTLTGLNFPNGLCSDAKGDVFIPNLLANDILEYAHGGTSLIATLDDTGQDPEACAFDPATGNLAVVNITSGGLGPGSISVYMNASGAPEVYSDPMIQLPYSCGYDDRSNLFVDGLTEFPSEGGVFQFAELPKGHSAFKTIMLDKTIRVPGGVQWDGKYMAVGDAITGVIYRTNGAGGKVEASTTLSGSDGDFQFFINGATIVAPSFYSSKVGFWNYPAGGRATRTLVVGSPYGVTVSVVPRKSVASGTEKSR
jgi:hypothetical protein